ncbi:MAG: hypothetical protein ACE366_15765 [Bradymonadia bacterium]
MNRCPACGEENDEGALTCKACGRALPGPASSAPGRARALSNQTLIGLPSPRPTADEEDVAVEAPAKKPPAHMKQTMFGAPSPLVQAPSKASSEASDTQRAERGAEEDKPKNSPNTVVEVSHTATQIGAPAVIPAVEKKTLFGSPSPLATGQAARTSSPKVTPAPTSRPAPVTPSPRPALATVKSPPPEMPESTVSGSERPEPKPAPEPSVARISKTPTPELSSGAARAKRRAAHHQRVPTGPSPVTEPSAEDAQDAQAAEAYAAARFAAAVAEDTQRARRQRDRKLVWVLAGLVLLLAAVAVLLWQARSRFTGEIAGAPTVSRGDDIYTITVPFKVSGPARLTYPGGVVAMKDAQTITFTLPVSTMKVGDNPITLTAIPEDGGETVERVLNVQLFYRITDIEVPRFTAGARVVVKMQVMPGWVPSVPGATIEPVADGHRLSLDPAPFLSKVDQMTGSHGPLPLALSLVGEKGKVQQFEEVLQLPIPRTRITVNRPVQGWSRAAEDVHITGRSLPGAQIAVGGVTEQADHQGHFDVKVPVPSVGSHTFKLVADAEARAPQSIEIAVERITSDVEKSRRRTRRGKIKALVKQGGLIEESWVRMVDNAEALRNQRVRLEGPVIALRRGALGAGDVILMATCPHGAEAKTHNLCPVRVVTRAPISVRPGEMLEVVGRLSGVESFQTQGGLQKAPRVLAEAMSP